MGLTRIIAIFAVTVSLFTFVAFFGRLPTFRYERFSMRHRYILTLLAGTRLSASATVSL